MTKFRLNRRTLLRGLSGGVVVGLPLLEAMLNSHGEALADGAKLPVRFLSFYWADGINIERFEPAAVGATWELSEELAPLADVKEYVSVLTGMQNRSRERVTHHEGMTVFNGYEFTLAQGGDGLSTDAGGPTIDQLIADTVGDATAVRAVHTQVSKRVSTDGDGGTNAISLSHRGMPGALTPQVPEIEPKKVWQTLFGTFNEPADTRAPRQKVLDAVREDVARLNKRLGAADKQRLEAHLEGLRELEVKIAAEPPGCTLPESPDVDNVDDGGREPLSEVNSAMAELIAYAFSCDVTRVASLMFKRFVSATVFDEINATEIHHSASHMVGNEDYHRGVVYQMDRLADLLTVFKNTADGPDSNLLDNAIIYASTECSTGFSHSIERQPVLVAGRGRGYLVHPGIHYQATPFNGSAEVPSAAGNTSDALLTCLRCFDENAASVGGGATESSEVIDELIA